MFVSEKNEVINYGDGLILKKTQRKQENMEIIEWLWLNAFYYAFIRLFRFEEQHISSRIIKNSRSFNRLQLMPGLNHSFVLFIDREKSNDQEQRGRKQKILILYAIE